MLLREVMVHEQSSMVRVVAAVTVMVWEPAVTTVAAGQKVVRLEDDSQHNVLKMYRYRNNLLGDDLSDVDGASRGGGVKSCSRGRGGESSNGGNGELHFDGVGLVVVVWEKGEGLYYWVGC